MEALAYYDGKIGTPEELTVPFNDRVHFFGDGVYDATVGANGKVYLMQDHLDRFYTSARALDIHIPMPKDELGRLLTDLLANVDGTTHFVYWQVTRGVETRNHVYAEDLPGKLWVSIRQNHLNDPDVPIKLNTEEDTRFYHCNIKTLNLLPSVAAAQHAKRIGVQETVFHRGDIVTECAHSNVSILKNGVFYSHPNDEFILRGIAKTHMIQACYRLGITVMEKCFTLDDLRNAGEVSSHTGTDIACAEGTPILAAADGIVTVANGLDSWGGSYGYYIQIDHGGGLETLYAHCSSICVTTGQQVQVGEVIGYVGHTGRATGSHLHLEVWVGRSRKDAMSFFSVYNEG